MPCWEVRTISLNLDAANPEVLQAALEALGFLAHIEDTKDVRVAFQGSYQGTFIQGAFRNGQLDLQSRTSQVFEAFAGAVKQRYAARSIEVAGARFRFQVRQDSTDASRYVLAKRV